MRYKINGLAAALVLALVCVGTTGAGEIPMETVSEPGQSAALVEVSKEEGKAYEIVYRHDTIAQPLRLSGSEMGVACDQNDKSCTLASTPGQRVAFRSSEGLDLVRRTAYQKLVSADISKQATLTQANLNAVEDPARLSFDSKDKPSRPYLPVTFNIAGGFGSVGATDPSPETGKPAHFNRTSKTAAFYVRIPMLPRKDHHAGNVGANFGVSTTWVAGSATSYREVGRLNPDFSFSVSKGNSHRKGARLWEFVSIDYETPSAGGLSGYAGIGLLNGHNDQRLFSTDAVTNHLCTEANRASRTLCDYARNIETSSSESRVVSDNVNWSGVGSSVYVGLKAHLHHYASLFMEWRRLHAGQAIDTFRVGTKITVWPLNP